MKKKVLIVDDETEIVDLILMILDDGHIQLFAAYDGVQALEMVREHRPDLVLSDVMMPRLDGRELCRSVKADPTTASTKVILMSAIHRLDQSEVPADALIRKPFDILSVAETIHNFLADR